MLKPFLFLSWFISIIVFSCLLVEGGNRSTFELMLLGLVFLVGVGSFIVLIFKVSQAIGARYRRFIAFFLSFFASIFLLAIGIGFFVLVLSSLPKPKLEPKQIQTEKTNYKLLQSPLKLGSQGEDVMVLQSALKKEQDIYPSGVISGYYGELTKEAVISFQKQQGLNETGEMDELTLNKFNEVYGSQSREQYLGSVPTSFPVRVNPPEQAIIQTNAATDPIVNCSVNANCGGGYKSVRNSECVNSTCCEVGKSWYWYSSKEKCRSDQDAYWKTYYEVLNAGSNYVVPTHTPISIPTSSYPTYSYPTYMPYPTSSYQSPPPNYAVLLQDCIDHTNDEYNSTMSILRAQGMGDSSSAVVAEQKRDNIIQQCQNLYSN